MFKSYHPVILLFSALTFISCNDDEMTFPEGNMPEFYTSFVVDGDRVEYKAGDEPFYMKSKTKRDENGVYSFIGELSDYNCATDYCPESVRFIFRDDTVLTENNSNINESLKPGTLPFYTPFDSLLSSVDVAFTSSTSKNPQQFNLNWAFGNGNTSTTVNPNTTYTAQIGEVNVVCKTQDSDSGTVSTNVLTADFTNDCSVDFTYQFSTGQISALNTQTKGQGPFTFEWDFGHGFMPLNDQPPLDFSGNDSIYACLRATSGSGCVSTRCKTLLVNPDYDIAVTDFEYDATHKYDVNKEHFGEFTLIYVDKSAKVYSTRGYSQPEFAFVNVIESGDYPNNEDGLKTRKTVLEFEVRVFGESETDFLDLKNGQASIAVAHP